MKKKNPRPSLFEPLEPRLQLSAGNILVSNYNGTSNQVFQYTQAGARVRTSTFSMSDGGIRDIVVDPSSRIQAFNGTATPSLTTRSGGTLTENTLVGWSTANVTDFGGIAAYKNYIYVTDQVTGSDAPTDQGVIRFDTSNNYAATRFATSLDPCDLSLGMDGLLYVLSGNSSSTAGTITVFDPLTMNVVNTITPPGIDNRAVAADSAGNIYVGSFNGTLTKIDSTGAVLNTIQTGADDLDMSSDNILLARTGISATLYDTGLNVVKTIPIPIPTSGAAFIAWATPQVPPAPADISGQIENDRDDTSTRTANDRPLANVRVYLDTNGSGTYNNGEPTALTDTSGNFTISAAPVGTFKLREEVPANFRESFPTKRLYYNVTVAGINQGGLLFLNTQKAELSGTVFNDLNANGAIDAGDNGIINVMVFIDANNNGVYDVGELNTLADPKTGTYLFKNITPGQQVIHAVRPRGFTQTSPGTGTYTLTFAAGQLASGKDYGFHQR